MNELENEKLLYTTLVDLVEDCEVVQIPFLLLGLLGENVAVVSVSSLDFARSGKRKALFGTGVGLKLCHLFNLLIVNNILIHHGLFLLNGSDHHDHPLAFQLRHAFRPAVIFEREHKTQEQFLSLVRELDGTSAEEDRSLDFGPFLEEFLGMLELELEVMLIGVGTEPDLLDDDLRLVGLHLLGLLLLLIQVLLVVQYLADGRIGLRTYLHQIQFKFIRHFQCGGERVNTRLGDVVTDKTDLRSGDLVIDVEFILPFLAHHPRTGTLAGKGSLGPGRSRTAGRLRFVRRCDKLILL